MNPSSFSGIYENLFGAQVAVFLSELKDNLLTVQISTPSEDGEFETETYEVSVSPNGESNTFTHESFTMSGTYIDLICKLVAINEPFDINKILNN